MNNYVVRQPVKDRDDQVIGNEVMFQLGDDALYNSSEDHMAAGTIANFFMQNNEKIYDGKLIFATFTPSLLFRNTPKIFESSKLIIQSCYFFSLLFIMIFRSVYKELHVNRETGC